MRDFPSLSLPQARSVVHQNSFDDSSPLDLVNLPFPWFILPRKTEAFLLLVISRLYWSFLLASYQFYHPYNTFPVMKGNIVTNLETTTVSPFNYLHPFLLNVN